MSIPVCRLLRCMLMCRNAQKERKCRVSLEADLREQTKQLRLLQAKVCLINRTICQQDIVAYAMNPADHVGQVTERPQDRAVGRKGGTRQTEKRKRTAFQADGLCASRSTYNSFRYTLTVQAASPIGYRYRQQLRNSTVFPTPVIAASARCRK